MATQKPISSISYNTEEFLREKLEAWKKAHIISTYMYICHKGEDGDKDHIHFRCEPNKKLDPMDLQEQLKQYTLDNPKPLMCRPFRQSSEEDWFLYVVHDAAYLKLKYGGGEKGEKIPYDWQNIVVPEDYDLEVAFIRAKAKMQHTSVNMATRLQQGENAISLILQGENPYMVNSIMRAMSSNDYHRLADEHAKLRSMVDDLMQKLYERGISVEVGDDGEVVLHDVGIVFEKADTEVSATFGDEELCPTDDTNALWN